jgi:hypothetical protein
MGFASVHYRHRPSSYVPLFPGTQHMKTSGPVLRLPNSPFFRLFLRSPDREPYRNRRIAYMKCRPYRLLLIAIHVKSKIAVH